MYSDGWWFTVVYGVVLLRSVLNSGVRRFMIMYVGVHWCIVVFCGVLWYIFRMANSDVFMV